MTTFLASMKRWCFFIVLFICKEGFALSASDSLLNTLRQEIANRERYINLKNQRIEDINRSLRALRNPSVNDRFAIYNRLYHEYKVFIYDSAFKYAQRLSLASYQSGEQSKIGYARLKTAFILVSSGMFKETFDSLRRIDITYLTDSTRLEYYSLMARAYYDAGEYDNDHYYNKLYLQLGNQYMDSAMRLCRPNTFEYLELSNYKNVKTVQIEAAMKDLEQLFHNFKMTVHQQAVNYHHLGLVSLLNNEPDKAMDAFIKSSLADVKTATKETASMLSLAQLLYKKGDINNAYICIEQAMEDALFYGARQRKVQIGSLLPIIASERLNKEEWHKQFWLIYSITLTILAALILVFVIIIVRQFRKLKVADHEIQDANNKLQDINKKLREADKIKEEYIGYYFNINSEYLDKIEIFKKSMDHKLLNKRFDELKFDIGSINPDREREALYFGFDKIFVKLFPDFLSTFNSYFSEEDKIVLKDGQLLNTELRIFALIRMGISDPERIAKILGYSVNTIYTYKTKIKNKSILPNEEFERRIKEIETI